MNENDIPDSAPAEPASPGPWQTRPSGAFSRPDGEGAGQQPWPQSGYPWSGWAPGGSGPGGPGLGGSAAGGSAAGGSMPGGSAPGGGYPVPAFGTPAPGPGSGSPAPAGGMTGGGGVINKPHRTGRGTLVTAAVAALALVAGFGGGLLSGNLASGGSASGDTALIQHSTGQNASATQQADGAAGGVQKVAANVLPSVVSVVALSAQSEGEGSGVVLTGSGLILTNNHVIDGADKLTVQFNDGTVANATVVGADPTDDLAVIKVTGVNGLTPATLGSSADVAVGQQVVAVGSPLGLSATVTTGIVSALNRPVRTQSAVSQQAQGTVLNAIQTDAAINPGNSGGPLVDMQGRVIGINSAIAALSAGPDGQAGSIGVGFAIPIDQAYRVAQEIINTGHASHAVLGANVTDHTDRTRGITTGAEIASVVPGSGAEKAGIAAGDVVTKVDSTMIESADALVATIRSAEPGGQVEVTYQRGGQAHTVTVTLGSSTS